MDSILAELAGLMGVKGSFVCARDGSLLARAMPAGTDDASLAGIGRSLMQTLTGLEVDRHKRPTDMEFAYADAMLLVKNLGTGYLCVLCARQANIAMINMTAGLAARKVKEALAAATAPPVSTTEAAETPPATAAEVPCLASAKVSQVEHELARAVGPVAMLVVDDTVAAMGCTREQVPVALTKDWLARLAREIPDEAKRAQFLQVAEQILRGG